MLNKFSKLANQMMWQLNAFGFTPGRIHLRLGLARPEGNGVVCTSIPKAGTNLLLRSVCLHPKFYRKFRRTLTDQNCKTDDQFESAMQSMSAGQVISSHLRYSEERSSEMERKGIKHLFIVRDPRDVIISYAHYAAKDATHYLRPVFEKIEKLSDRIRLLIVGDPDINLQPIGKRYQESNGWLSSAHVIRFEDVVNNEDDSLRQRTVEKMLNYLQGQSFDQGLVEQISNNIVSSQTRTFRKGVSGEWKTVFDQELVDCFKETAGQELIDFGYEKGLDWSI